jgi:hypothetical protein
MAAIREKCVLDGTTGRKSPSQTTWCGELAKNNGAAVRQTDKSDKEET